MTNKELIQELKKYPEDFDINLSLNPLSYPDTFDIDVNPITKTVTISQGIIGT